MLWWNILLFFNFFEIEELRRTFTSDVINILGKIKPRYGIPDELYSDNGPQFASYEFGYFA